ncbi:hypothetical protein OG320_16390 [Microbispora sp. NBC_01189]|uniref:hypothetical protein n=1 Tax=Microbispora sp. NBC_01189 TaxID=2903583 RepID=UPI002E12FF3B|nr:hypothetical protein OG320_16390 [Microbispora sp. NBC_01189]
MTTTQRAVLAMCSLVLLAGCGQDKQRALSSPDDIHRRGEALVAVVQCFLDTGLIPNSQLSGTWLSNGRIEPDATFTVWVSGHADTVYRGKTLSTWEDEATAAWPRWRCPF